jgi:hypothetical protein
MKPIEANALLDRHHYFIAAVLLLLTNLDNKDPLKID